MTNDSTARLWIIGALAVLALTLLPGINHGLWRPDEPRVAGTCAEMARTHDFVVPHLNGVPFLEKPPLYYAAGALSGMLLGIDHDLPYRLISILFAVLTLITVYAVAARVGGRWQGIMTAGVLASLWEFFMLVRWVQVDIALVFGVTLALYAYLVLMDAGKLRHAILLGVAAGIAFMAKGLIGPAIIAAAILMDMVRRRDFGVPWKIRPHVVIVFAVLVILPWCIALWVRGGWPFLREVLVVNNLMRFTGAPEGAALGHQHGALFYFSNLPGALLPWTLIFIPALISAVRNYKEDPYLPWVVGPFVLLLLSSTKRSVYLAPLFPAIACMIAVWLDQNTRHVRWEEVMVKITWGLAVAGCLAPFAGIFLGLPVWGAVLGILAILALGVLWYKGRPLRPALSLVLIVCIAMSASTAVFYRYETPRRDYLSFTREALAVSGSHEIIILAPDEIFEGVLPLLTGKYYKVVSKPADVTVEGYYIFPDRETETLDALRRHGTVDVVLERQLDHQAHKFARLVHVVPNGH